MAHSSWFIYESMNRIYKHYSFNFQDTHTAAQSLSFSSYPGARKIQQNLLDQVSATDGAMHKTTVKNVKNMLSGFLESLDDFYLLGSKMVLLQTTNNVFNMTLYDAVQPQALFAWQRVRVANYMANSGKQWADVLRRYNSGTALLRFDFLRLICLSIKNQDCGLVH